MEKASGDPKNYIELPFWANIAPLAFNVLVLMIPKSRLRDTFFLPLPTFAFLYLWLNFTPRGPFRKLEDQIGPFSGLVGQMLITPIYCYFEDPERDYLRQGETKPLAERNATLWERLKWALSIQFSLRGATWNWQVKNIPPAPPRGYPRLTFLRQRVLRFAFAAAVAVAVKSYAAKSPQNAIPPKNIHFEPLLVQIRNVWLFNLVSWSQLQAANIALSMIAVTLHISEPWEWPPLFGKWSDTYTVRKMWGSTWHQMLRRTFNIYVDWLAYDILHLKKGTFASRYTQLFAAFALSGAIHAVATWPISYISSHSMEFFLSQAAMIFVEDHVTKFGREVLGFKFNLFWRIVGYVWVFLWFSFSEIDWCAQISDMGIWAT